MSVRQKIGAIMAEIGAIAKTQQGAGVPYRFRSIDDVLARLHPLLVKHGLFYVPELVDMTMTTHEKWTRTTVKVKYTVYDTEQDGDAFLTAVVPGEGLDNSDKSCGKAMTYAEKTFLTQLFAIPSQNGDDPDFDRPGGPQVAKASAAREVAAQRIPPPDEAAAQFIDEVERNLIDMVGEGMWPDRGKIAEVLYLQRGRYPTDVTRAAATARWMIAKGYDISITTPDTA